MGCHLFFGKGDQRNGKPHTHTHTHTKPSNGDMVWIHQWHTPQEVLLEDTEGSCSLWPLPPLSRSQPKPRPGFAKGPLYSPAPTSSCLCLLWIPCQHRQMVQPTHLSIFCNICQPRRVFEPITWYGGITLTPSFLSFPLLCFFKIFILFFFLFWMLPGLSCGTRNLQSSTWHAESLVVARGI